MTPLSIESTQPVSGVRRTAPVDNGRSAVPAETAGESRSPRPGVVVNLNASASQAALNGLTYGNPRNAAATRQSPPAEANRVADAQAQADRQQRSDASARTQANAQANTRAQAEAEAARTAQRQDGQAAAALNATSAANSQIGAISG